MINLYNADCLEKMKEIPAESIDMILCDLPYGVTRCEWDKNIDLKKLWNEYERIIKENSVEIMQTTPSVMKFHLENLNDENSLKSLKYIMLAGEPLTKTLVDRIKQIINEQLDNVDKFEEVKEVPAKKKKDKKKIDEKQIEEQIETAKKMPKDEKKKIYKKVFANIILGILVTLYFIGIGIGFLNIDGPTFITDLKVFSLSILTIAIILFEFAYGKDDDKTALYGVEMLFVAIMSLVLLYTCILHKDKFIAVANIVACIGVLYYLVKSISIYIREKLKWKKTISDVKEIVAEE